jgi:PAS domain S-box-containing protein
MTPPFRVLLVDDEPGLLEVGKVFLERVGPFSVETCDSGDRALDLLARDPFEAVVSDYQMPGLDGIQLLALVRKRFGRLPFILFTGRGREEVVIRALNEGVDFYVQKGGDPMAQFAELAHQTQVAIERRTTERALEENERRFRALIQNSSDIIRIIDRDGRIAYESDSGARILGHPPGRTLGRSPLEFIHPEDHESVREALGEVYANTNPGTPTGFRIRHADGGWVAVESVAANLIGVPGVDGIVTTTWPVEARRRAEEALLLSERRFRQAEDALRLSEEHYRTLAEDMPVCFCTFRPDGTLTYVNTALAAQAGRPPEELLGRSFFGMISPADREIVRAALGRLTPDRPVETHEQSCRAPDGTTSWQQWTNRAFFDEEGDLVRLQAVGLDITALRETEEALRRANRTLTLVSGITRHDIENQLAVLRGYLALAQVEEAGPAVAAFLERGTAAAARIASLIRFAEAWEGMGAHPPAWLDARGMVEDAAREVAPGAVRVENALPAGLRVWADPLCTRVVAGLIENALRHGGAIATVGFSAAEADDGGLTIVCEDDGAGVPADAKERIFERGYGANTGLGLFLAREALGLTGIAITESGAPGAGARFELAVPPGGWRLDTDAA